MTILQTPPNISQNYAWGNRHHLYGVIGTFDYMVFNINIYAIGFNSLSSSIVKEAIEPNFFVLEYLACFCETSKRVGEIECILTEICEEKLRILKK